LPRSERTIRVAFLIAALTGCGEEVRATRPPATVQVSGRVRDGARPVAGGWVEFLPVDGTVGHLRSAPLDQDGVFRLAGLGIGRHAVRLVHRNPVAIDPMFQQFTSPLRVDVTPGARIDIDLARERARLLEDPTR
jgi:hypothetical protein